jgi:hypothetical protein
MDTTKDQLLSDYPDPSQAFDGVTSCVDDASQTFSYPDPSLLLERVSGCLDDALRSFVEGDSEQACRYLAEANLAFESCSAEKKSEAGVTRISRMDGIPSRPVEREAPLLTRAATA